MAKKVRRKIDPWKLKRWFNLYGPECLGRPGICLVPAKEPEDLIGRIATIHHSAIGGSRFSPLFLKFRIKEVNGNNAETDWHSVESTNNEISRYLARRRISKVEVIIRDYTKDNVKLKSYVYVITAVKIGQKQKKAIRKIAEEIIYDYYKNKSKDEIMKAFLDKEIQRKIVEASKKIAPIIDCVLFKCVVLNE